MGARAADAGPAHPTRCPDHALAQGAWQRSRRRLRAPPGLEPPRAFLRIRPDQLRPRVVGRIRRGCALEGSRRAVAHRSARAARKPRELVRSQSGGRPVRCRTALRHHGGLAYAGLDPPPPRPPVLVALARCRGLARPGARLPASVGLGEAPLLRQATFSLWHDQPAMDAYARSGAHLEAIRQAYSQGFFSESMFTRFRVLEIGGHWPQASPALGERLGSTV